jgi:hypothetical protein
VLFFIYGCIGLSFAGLLYVVEPRSNILTFSQALWLTLVSMTTIGYGDYIPRSPTGSVLVGILVIITMFYAAIPLGIIGSAFSGVWHERESILLKKQLKSRLFLWGYTAEDIPKLFQLFDDKGDGQLDLVAFREMIFDLGLGITERTIVQLFNLFDDDGSGAIDAKEFVRELYPKDYSEVFGEEVDHRNEEDVTKTSSASPSMEVQHFHSSGAKPLPVRVEDGASEEDGLHVRTSVGNESMSSKDTEGSSNDHKRMVLQTSLKAAGLRYASRARLTPPRVGSERTGSERTGSGSLERIDSGNVDPEDAGAVMSSQEPAPTDDSAKRRSSSSKRPSSGSEAEGNERDKGSGSAAGTVRLHM